MCNNKNKAIFGKADIRSCFCCQIFNCGTFLFHFGSDFFSTSLLCVDFIAIHLILILFCFHKNRSVSIFLLFIHFLFPCIRLVVAFIQFCHSQSILLQWWMEVRVPHSNQILTVVRVQNLFEYYSMKHRPWQAKKSWMIW